MICDNDEAKHIEELILFEANEVASSTTKETNNPLRSLSYETLHEIVRYVSLDDCLCNLRFKLKLEDATDDDEFDDLIQTFLHHVDKFIETVCSDYTSPFWNWTASKMQADDSGNYIVVYHNGTYKEGTSETRLTRLSNQGYVFAAGVMDNTQPAPDEFIKCIANLQLPNLSFHEDHTNFRDDLIKRQIIEMIRASS